MCTMTRSLLSLLVLAAASTPAAYSAVQATIPFSFSIPAGVVPAGTYRFEQPHTMSGNRTLVITNVETRRSMMLIHRFDEQRPDEPAELVFRCVAQTCELTSIRVGGGKGWGLSPSRDKFAPSAYISYHIPLKPAVRHQAD